MTRVGLVGCTPDFEAIIAAALAEDGIAAGPLALNAETARTTAKLSLDALIVDGLRSRTCPRWSARCARSPGRSRCRW